MATVSLRIVYLILLLVIGFNGEYEFPKDKEVIVLTNDNFEKAIESNKNLLVMFYAPWCGFSRALLKDFAEAAEKLADEGSPIKLAKINSPNAPTLQRQYRIGGYPTLKFFKDGQALDYTGGRDTESLISFVKSHAS